MPIIELFDGFCLGIQEVDKYIDSSVSFRPWQGEELLGEMNDQEKNLWSLFMAEINKFVGLTGLEKDLILKNGGIARVMVVDIEKAELFF